MGLALHFPVVLILRCQRTVTRVNKGLTKPDEALIVVAQEAVVPAFLQTVCPIAVVVVFIICGILAVVEVPIVGRLSDPLAVPVMGYWPSDFHVYMPLVIPLRSCCLWHIFTPPSGLSRYMLLLWHRWLHGHVKVRRVRVLKD